jgi:ABC-2 type transport system permease protein
MSFPILFAEIKRAFRLARSYSLEYISDFILYVAGFLLLIVVFRASSDSYGQVGILSTLIGYVTWKICASVLVNIAHIADDEAKTGTLESLYVTGIPSGSLFLARSVGIVLNEGMRGLILGIVLALVFGVLQPGSILAFFVFLLTLTGACGLGFALAGLVLLYKRMGGLLNLVWQMLVFFTGALAPIQQPIFATTSRVLPLSWGIECLRAAFIEKATVLSLWQNGLMVGLLINTSFYVVLGVFCFKWGERQARMQGVLAHY